MVGKLEQEIEVKAIILKFQVLDNIMFDKIHNHNQNQEFHLEGKMPENNQMFQDIQDQEVIIQIKMLYLEKLKDVHLVQNIMMKMLWNKSQGLVNMMFLFNLDQNKKDK